MKTISKSKLKAHMLQIFREIEETGEELIVTDRDRPVLRIEPFKRKKKVTELFSECGGKVEYLEDINTPTEAEWLET